MWRLIILISLFFAGCVKPAEIFFRNFSNQTVRLQALIIDRRRFDKLPNRITFYDTSTKKRQYYGDWRANGLVTWIDTATLYVDVPAFTVVNLEDVSNGLTLGTKQPDVLLLMIVDNKIDTLINCDFFTLADKFKAEGYNPFGKAIYYYDFH